MLDELRRRGLPEGERSDVWVLSDALANQGDVTRLRMWACESILYALREIARPTGTDWAVVVRCFGQAREYTGRVGGSFASVHVHDALLFLQNEIERKIRGTS
jgi:hypothetical protein